jgi:hypothetical protein
MPNRTDDILQKLKPFERNFFAEIYSDAEHKELLLSAGISEAEYRLLQSSLKEYLIRANGLLKHKLYSEAVFEYNKARLISPLNQEILIGLANAYLSIYKKHYRKEYKDEAENFAHLCLKINPKNNAALRVLSGLKNFRIKQKNQ